MDIYKRTSRQIVKSPSVIPSINMLRVGLLLVGAITLVSSNEELLSETAAVDLVAPPSVLGKPLINQAAVINYINQKQSLWKAGKNFDDDVSEDYLRRLASARLPEEPLPMLKTEKTVTDDYPENFDARNKWTKCPSISHIYDQGNCGSCWAVSVASVIADRTCIASDGKFTSPISAQEIMSCCTKCGYGCEGGWPDKAFKFYQKHGVSTGGDYDSKEGCIPYEIEPCSHHVDGRYRNCKSYNTTATPVCRTKCSNSHYKVPRKRDRHFGYACYEISAQDMKHELSHHGPVNAIFSVYEDFFHYKSGIYDHVWGTLKGKHAVRVIGWGKENGVAYWLVANSWNEEWGDKGLFKIKQGINEVRFEEYFMSAENKK
nr:PREDICTED: cathepsin B-like cysteine proteinase 4 isoform X2 [Bemisia tabaci]